MGSRIRQTPYHSATVAAGVQSFSVYNHMLIPGTYGDPEAEYWRLIDGVVMWDVACQRQIEVTGPDAFALAQAVCTRNLEGTEIGQGRYTAMVDHAGRLINDPLVLRADEDRWWISIADGDILQWCRAVAGERNMAVDVDELEVAPLAVQGPKAEDVVAGLIGDWVRSVRFFRYERAELDGMRLRVGRAGWSKQGGFELYLEDADRGTDLWNAVAAAGEPFGIVPASPNRIERIESGLLSYRTDTDDATDPFEANLGRYVDLEAGGDYIGRDALVAKRERGLQRQLVGVYVGDEALPVVNPVPLLFDGAIVGTLRDAARSPRVGRSIGLALVDVPHNTVGSTLETDAANGSARVEVARLPFID